MVFDTARRGWGVFNTKKRGVLCGGRQWGPWGAGALSILRTRGSWGGPATWVLDVGVWRRDVSSGAGGVLQYAPVAATHETPATWVSLTVGSGCIGRLQGAGGILRRGAVAATHAVSSGAGGVLQYEPVAATHETPATWVSLTVGSGCIGRLQGAGGILWRGPVAATLHPLEGERSGVDADELGDSVTCCDHGVCLVEFCAGNYDGGAVLLEFDYVIG